MRIFSFLDLRLQIFKPALLIKPRSELEMFCFKVYLRYKTFLSIYDKDVPSFVISV